MYDRWYTYIILNHASRFDRADQDHFALSSTSTTNTTLATGPSDRLDHKIARILQTPCESRTRLGEGQYWGRIEQNPFGLMEETLENILAAEPIFDRVCKAAGEKLPFFRLNLVADKGLELGVISEDEANLLRKTEEQRLKVINVDDFDPADLAANKSMVTKTSKKTSKAA